MTNSKIIDGKALSAQILEDIKNDVTRIRNQIGEVPGLAVVLVGENPASEIYVRNKIKKTEEVGMKSFEFRYTNDVSEQELLTKINDLNNDKNVSGILVQLPLPPHIKETAVINAVDPAKDVDGFHVANVGRLATGQSGLVSCTPLGCMIMLKQIFPDGISGKKAVVIGKSNIVGRPMAQLLMNENATVTVCHRKTLDIENECRQADILISACGQPHMIKENWVKNGAVVIDIGINRIVDDNGNAKIVGDVDFEDVLPVVSKITPVPGGVGPMTIACLLLNTLTAFAERRNRDVGK